MYQVNPKTKSEQNHLRSLSLSTEAYDFWTMPKKLGDTSDVLVPPDFQANFEKFLQKFNIAYTITVDNVETFVQKEQYLQSVSRALSQRLKFNRYYSYNEILEYLDKLATKYPKLVTVKTIGKSFENRDIKTITISDTEQATNRTKNTILVDAGIHAREWIAPATALYIIHELVENYAKNKNVLNNLNWIVVPVLNPDGYEYTHTEVIFKKLISISSFFTKVSSKFEKRKDFGEKHENQSDDASVLMRIEISIFIGVKLEHRLTHVLIHSAEKKHFLNQKRLH